VEDVIIPSVIVIS